MNTRQHLCPAANRRNIIWRSSTK